jgi:hypothetical protein
MGVEESDMQRLKIAFWTGVLIFSGSLAAQPPPTGAPGIDGIQLGMRPDEARAVLRARKRQVHQFRAMLSYTDKVTRLPIHVPNSNFLNVLMQTSGSGEAAEKLTVYFSPTPGNERVVAIRRHRDYPADAGIRELDLRNALAQQYGELPATPAARLGDAEFSQVWNLPTGLQGSAERCELNLMDDSAQMDLRNPDGAPPANYVLANHDLILNLIDDRCGPSVVQVGWKTRTGAADPRERVLESETLAILSVEVASESMEATSRMLADLQATAQKHSVQSASMKAGANPR